MKTVKITYANNDTSITCINGSEQAILDYYFNNEFNIGKVKDNIQKVIKVEFI